MALYDVSTDALRFVTSALIHSLPIFHLLLGFLLSLWTLAFLMRIVLTWYPQVNLKAGVWRIIFFPTEPILAVTRKVVAPIGGVDVTPVIWLGFVSLVRELLVGQQGVLSQLLLKSDLIK